MNGRHPASEAASAAALVLLLALALGASPAEAASRDRTPPTAPTNLHVTGKTSSAVSLAWSPSTDNSGDFFYVIHASTGTNVSVSRSATSYTWSTGLRAGDTYSFTVSAVDAAGNRSRNSNTVAATLPAAPALSLTDVGPTHVSLAWTPWSGDGSYVTYWVYVDGSPVVQGRAGTSITLAPLEPETTYTFTVQARDNGQNFSPLSNAVTVTTAPPDPNDTTPPTTPANLWEMHYAAEVWLFWDPSTDDLAPQSLIEYQVYVNGTFDHSFVGRSETVVYGRIDGLNTFEVIAVDTSGNRSAPAALTLNLDLDE